MIGGSYQLIVQLIQLAQTQAINQAEQKLAEIAQQNSEMINNLIFIMKDQSQKFTTQMGAAAYLNSAISDGIFPITKEQTIRIIGVILKDKDINPKYKRLLERCIISVLDSTQDPLLTQFRELVYILIQQPILRDAAYLLIACFAIPESMDIQHVIYLTRMYFRTSLDSIVLPNSQQTFYLANQINQILKTWVVVWDRLYKQYQSYQKIIKQSQKKKTNKSVSLNLEPIKILEQFTQLQSISSLILNLYRWMSQQPTFICTHPELFELNILKEQAANLHYRILKVCYKKQSESIIVKMTGQIMQPIIENFLMITGNRKALDQYSCRQFFVSLAKVIKQFICCKPKWFQSCWKQLLVKVIFPLMKPEEDELISFQQNSVEFCSLFQDCTEKQTYEIIKTQMCKLVQVLSDKSEYITQKQFIPDFLVNFSVQSIKSYFRIKTQNIYDCDFILLDTSIIILCILSYRISNHVNKINELKHVLSSENAYKSSAYDRALLYLFLAYNYGDVYQKPEEGSTWVHLALSQNEHPTTTHCANDMLFNIADEYYSDYFVQQISNKILTNKSPYIFDSIQKIIKTQTQNISEGLMVEIIQKVYHRLSNQISMINLEAKQTITILKLIQILKVLVDKDDYCKENLAVRQMIWKIMEIFEKALQMDFEDQIFYILEGLLRQQNQISQRSKKMLPFILKQFAEDEYYEPFYYRIINLFIMKSTAEIIPYILKSIQTGIIFHSMKMGQSMKKSERRLINSHLLILIQNALAVHGRTLNSDQIIEISAIVIRYLPIEDDKIDCNVVLARALNCLLMCHILVRAQGTWEYVYKYHSRQIFYNYDIRVLLSCIKVCIVAQENVVVSAQMLAIGANAITLFRKRQRLDKKSQQIKQKFGKDNRLKLVKYKEFQQILKYLKTPFQSEIKLEDEYSQLISNLKKTNVNALNTIFAQIPKEQQQVIIQMTKMKDLSENDPSKRHKFTVLRVKAPENVKDDDEDKTNQSTLEQAKLDEEQQEEGEYKRKRIENKKKRKDKEMKE